MAEIAEVVADVERTIKRLGDDTKGLKDSLGRDITELRGKAEGLATESAATNAELKALSASVLAKHEAIEKQVQTAENTVGTLKEQLEALQVSLKRPGSAGAPADVAKRLGEALHFKTCQLAINGQLKVGMDIESQVDLKEMGDYEKAFGLALRRDEKGLDPEVYKTLRTGIDPDGGFLVTPAMSSRILTRIREISPLRQFATVETIASDKLEIPRDLDDVTDGWVGEEQPVVETSTPQVGVQMIPVNEQRAQPKVTQRILEDASINIEAWLANKVADKFGRTEAAAFINGNGVNKPRGLLAYPTSTTTDDTRAWQTFQHIVSGHATLLTADALVKLPLELKEFYLSRARWLMNRLTVQAIMLLKDGEGRYLWQPSFTEGVPSSLLGYPVSMATDMPLLGAGSLSVGFGDIATTYTVVDRLGLSTLRDPYTAKPFVLYYTRRRVGGAAVHFEAFKFIRTAAS